MPPPAVASTLMRAISCCSFSCMRCACCIICCMFPGSFTGLLLQISNLSNFAAEDLAEALHFPVCQSSAGGVRLAFVGPRRSVARRGGRAGFANHPFDPIRLRRDLLQSFVHVVRAQRELVRGGGDEFQPAAALDYS